MWGRVIDFGKKIFTLSSRLEKQEEKFADLSKKVDQLTAEVGDLYKILHAMSFELERQRDQAAHERELAARDMELLQVKLQNVLLRNERGLPPRKDSDH